MVPGLPGEFFPWLKENVTRSLCTARGELGAFTRTYWVGRKVGSGFLVTFCNDSAHWRGAKFTIPNVSLWHKD